MNRDRLQDIYRNTHLADKSDIDSIRQLTVDYPYYNLPYVILSKYYHDTRHYKFEDMLRQAAMRVKDRQALYDYIHGISHETVQLPLEKAIEIFEEEEPQIQEQAEVSVDAFLNDESPEAETIQELAPIEPEETILEQAPVQEEQAESDLLKSFLEDSEIITEAETVSPVAEQTPAEEPKPFEFVLDTTHETPAIDKIEIDHDIIGEEIETEFSFSKSFVSEEQEPETVEEPIHNIEVFEDSAPKPVDTEGNYFRDVQTKAPEAEDHEPKPEMDFFAWLKAPKLEKATEQAAVDTNSIIHAEPAIEAVIEPETEGVHEEDKEEEEESNVSNLDLIDRFIKTNPQISRPKKEFFNPENMAKKGEVLDLEFVTETLANIYYEQGNYELAIKAYEKLSLQNPSKQAYFANLIEKIRKERK